jgi:hypothetical protein
MERIILACGGNAVNSTDELCPEDLVKYISFIIKGMV